MLLDAMRRFIILNAALWFAGATLMVSPGEKPPEPAKHASLYEAHQVNSDEKVTIGAEPFDSREKDSIFPIDYSKHGLLPVRVVISNDSDQPIQLLSLKFELNPLGGKEHFGPASWADVGRKVASEGKQPSDHPNPLPRGPLGIPLPGGKGKGKLKDAKLQFEELGFAARAVEPHGSQSGFVFFDVGEADMPPTKARFFVSGIRNSANQELFYFEIPLYPNARVTTAY